MRRSADVVVVGAGTAGLHAATCLAESGRRVVVLERRPEGHSGARWCNGIVAWQFERAGLAPPVAPELRARGGVTHLLSPSGTTRVSITSSPVLDADMRALVQRLLDRAHGAGVEVLWDVTDVRPRLDDAVEAVPTDRRVRGVHATWHGEVVDIAADLVVDASGRAGVVRDAVPALAAAAPPVEGVDLCSAQQLVLDVDDPDGARAFLAEHGARPGDIVSWMAPDGGFSIQSIHVAGDLDEASLLTGSIADGRHRSGSELMADLRRRHPWLGAQRFGGGGTIPLRRTPARFAAPGVALVGDAACHVMAAHGSGIGFGLIAGRVLADALAHHDDPGSDEATWRYQRSFLREFGPTIGSFDVFRRMSVGLGTAGIEQLMASGLFDEEMAASGLEQRLVDPPISHLVGKVAQLARHRAITRRLAPALVRGTAARAIYRVYPRRPNEAALRRWARAERVLLGA